jgi:hypothetical protein
MKHEEQHYFILRPEVTSQFSFTGYTNKTDNVLMQIFKGRKEGKPESRRDVPHRFKFDEAHRSIRVHWAEKSIVSTLVPYEKKDGVIAEKKVFLKSVDVLRNHPNCKGSPNGNGTWMFSELKESEDAKTANDAKQVQLDALNAGMNMNAGEIREMGALFGKFGTDNEIIKHFLLEKASAEPATWLEHWNSPERSAKALLKKAVDMKIVSVQGTLYNWGNETLGHDENSAVAKIIGSKEIDKALRERVKGGMK